MVRKTRVVYVPFEIAPDKTARKCNDLPRFGTTQAVRWFLELHGQGLSHRMLEWREHEEKEFIEEYLAGVGTPYPPVIARINGST